MPKKSRDAGSRAYNFRMPWIHGIQAQLGYHYGQHWWMFCLRSANQCYKRHSWEGDHTVFGIIWREKQIFELCVELAAWNSCSWTNYITKWQTAVLPTTCCSAVSWICLHNLFKHISIMLSTIAHGDNGDTSSRPKWGTRWITFAQLGSCQQQPQHGDLQPWCFTKCQCQGGRVDLKDLETCSSDLLISLISNILKGTKS
jgi:hypothetical protein